MPRAIETSDPARAFESIPEEPLWTMVVREADRNPMMRADGEDVP
jgi:hypothetical protein